MHRHPSCARTIAPRLLPVFAALSLSTGCVQVEQALVLNEDGSGTLHLRYSVAAEALAALSLPGQAPAPIAISEEDIRRDLARYRPFGIRLLDARVDQGRERTEVDLRLGFDDLRSLALTSFFADNRLRLAPLEGGRWVLEQNLVPPDARDLDVDLHPPGQAPREGFPEDFRAVFVVTVPAAILETNADAVEGRTARWVLGAEGKPEAIRFARGEPMRLVFDGEGLTLPEPRRMSMRLPAPD